MRVTDTDTDLDFYLDVTDELQAELSALNQRCSHPTKEARRRRNKGGAIQYIDQCLRCGGSVGMFRKHTAELASAPAWDEELGSELINFAAAGKQS
jgi:hypothetical protein